MIHKIRGVTETEIKVRITEIQGAHWDLLPIPHVHSLKDKDPFNVLNVKDGAI